MPSRAILKLSGNSSVTKVSGRLSEPMPASTVGARDDITNVSWKKLSTENPIHRSGEFGGDLKKGDL
jgi:hypothetical protein